MSESERVKAWHKAKSQWEVVCGLDDGTEGCANELREHWNREINTWRQLTDAEREQLRDERN